MFKIVTADQRLATPAKINILLFAPSGWGKTYQARFLDPKKTLFVNAEAGDLALGDWQGDVFNIREIATQAGVHPWEMARAMACVISGPDPADRDGPYSKAAYDYYCATFGGPEVFAKYDTIYWDSITVASRWAFEWAKMQPQAISEKTGKLDTRGAYGLLGNEMVRWLTQIQHTASKSTIAVGILDRVVDDLKRVSWEPQIEGSKTSREAPGIFDIVLTGAELETPEGQKYKAFVCQFNNPWGFPAKDRSGKLELQEPPDLGQLIHKIRTGQRLDAKPDTATPAATTTA